MKTRESLPLRERGLKSSRKPWACLLTRVAPFTGAWIEIWQPREPRKHRQSLPLRERGLKSMMTSRHGAEM